MSTVYRLLARGLTVGRFAATFPFLHVLLKTGEEPRPEQATALGLFFLAIAISDLLDGVFARMAKASNHRWGQLDAAADILFNTSSLFVAAWLGILALWVPAAVVLLAAQFIYRNKSSEAVGRVRLSEDRLGKLAGVIYYLLVGAVVTGVWLGTEAARIAVWWLGNLVFAYTVALLVRNSLTGWRVSGQP